MKRPIHQTIRDLSSPVAVAVETMLHANMALWEKSAESYARTVDESRKLAIETDALLRAAADAQRAAWLSAVARWTPRVTITRTPASHR